jgi:hypothetical protein
MGLLIKLKNGDTSLKSLKFGNDRPGGGDSGQPYIQNPIDRPNTPTLNSDFLLRGGISAPLNAAEDVARLTKYFFDLRNPSGLLFTAKQNLLSRTAVKAEVAEKISGNIPGPAYGGGTINEGIYTPLSTIAEAGIVAFGGHLNKQGIDPTGLAPTLAIKKYGPTSFVLNEPQYNKWFESPTQTQDFTLSFTPPPTRFDTENTTKDLNFSNRLLRLWYTKELPNVNNNPNLYSYSGGPGSTLGIGDTNIKFGTLGDGLTPLRTGVNNIQFQNNKKEFLSGKTQEEIQVNKFYLNNIDGTPTYQDTLDITKFLGASKLQNLSEDKIWYNGVTSESSQEIINNNVLNLGKALVNGATITGFGTWSQPDFISQSSNPDGTTTPDFRTILVSDYTKTFLGEPYKPNNNIETLFNLGNPGQKGDLSDYKKGKVDLNSNSSKALDTVNASYIYKSSDPYPKNDPLLYDLIPFRIAILNNENQSGIVYKKYMHFRAFINEFSDSYGADWDNISYMGRAEKFYKYKGFNRDISLGFTIVAQSVQELTPMYDKLNFLASSLAPEYLDASTSGYMAGNIAYITLGDYLSEQPGIITSLDYTIPDDTTWEVATNRDGTIDVDGNNKRELRRLPHRIEVSMKFTPIHTFRPQKQVFQEDKSDKKSTRLLGTGKAKYIDPLRPDITNYDREGAEGNISLFNSESFDIPIQSLTDQNIIPQ